MSYKSILKSNILSIEDKTKKRNVKIKCHNNKAGKLVIQTIQQNTSLFGGYKMKEIESGITAKDFTVKFEIRDGAKTFYNNLTAIINDASVATTEPEKSGWQTAGEKIEQKIDTAFNAITGSGQPVPETAPEAAPGSAPETASVPDSGSDGPDDGSKMKTLLIAGGVLLTVIVIALVLWKKK